MLLAQPRNVVSEYHAVVERLRPALDAYFAKFKIRHYGPGVGVPIPKEMD